jgi:isoquinoline 1-oxidoreductase beta subunit
VKSPGIPNGSNGPAKRTKSAGSSVPGSRAPPSAIRVWPLVPGQLAAKAATMPVPVQVTLKDPKDWIYIGKSVPRVDSIAKTTGKAIFSFDVKRPGMLTAVLARPPRFGATIKSFDATAAKAQTGVVEVVQVPQGAAVLATDTWSAIKGRQELKIEWDDTKAEKPSSEEIFAEYRKLAAQPGKAVARRGDADAALKGAANPSYSARG